MEQTGPPAPVPPPLLAPGSRAPPSPRVLEQIGIDPDHLGRLSDVDQFVVLSEFSL